VRRLITRTSALALCVTVALGATVPCMAAEPAGTRPAPKLTDLSAASRQVLAIRAPTAAQQPPAAGPTSSSSFFKSTRGKVTLALMGAGVGLTLWSINHDRKPVKSPIR
jgi:hypothetical protein